MKGALANLPLRELLVALMGIVAGHGIVSENLVQILLPLMVAAAATVQGWAQNVGRDKVASLFRKMLSLFPGAAVSLGWITLEQAEAWLLLIPILGSSAWSSLFKMNT